MKFFPNNLKQRHFQQSCVICVAAVASVFGYSSSVMAQKADRVASEAYAGQGGPRNGQQGADNGWNFLGFDLGGLWRSRTDGPVQKGDQMPKLAPPESPQDTRGRITSTPSTPEQGKNFNIPYQLITAKPETAKMWVFNPQGQRIMGCYSNMPMKPIPDTGGLPLYKDIHDKIYYKMNDGSGVDGGPDWRPYPR